MKKFLSILLILVLCLTFMVACGNNKVSQGLKDAETFLNNLYKDKATETPSDYEVVGKVIIGKDTYTVEWTVSVTEGVKVVPGDDGMVTIDVDEKAANDIEYVLKATIKDANGKSVTKEFNRKVPKYKVNTWAEYAAAAKEDKEATVVVQGVISAINSKTLGSSSNSLYIQDATNAGGYYVYNISEDPGAADSKLKVGATVEVKGTVDLYNGTYEIINASVEVIKEEPTAVTPVDFTEIYKNAASLKDTSLAGPQALIVTIKGVEITGQNTAQGYYHFKLGDKESYVRISSSNNAITKDEQATFIKNHTDHFGYLADVTGIVTVYDGAFYLQPITVDAFNNFRLPERTDAEKVELEAGNAKLPERIEDDSTITLPTPSDAYKDVVTFAWESDNACAVIADGKLKVTLPEVDTIVKITLTATCGNETKTAEFTIKVSAASTDNYLPVDVKNPVKDTTYKFYLAQNTLGENLYFAGYMSGNYLATTNKADKGVDVKLEEVDGGFYLYFMDGETKTYIEIYEYSAGKVGVHLTTETPTNKYTVNADLGILVSNVAGNDYYLGTYDKITDGVVTASYSTMSASKLSYITGDNASKIGVSQFPAYLATLTPADFAPVDVKNPAKDTTYKFYLAQNTLGENLYFAGYMSGNYLATTNKADKAVDVKLEEVDGGFYLYFMDGETKTYIEIYEYSAGKVGVHLTTETPTNKYTVNADLGILVSNVAGNDYYLGTYDKITDGVVTASYSTMSASKLSYITGDNASKIGVSQFPAYLATLKLEKIAPANVTAPAKDTAYKFYLAQNTLGENLYFAGYMSGNYLATTNKLSKAVDVKLEEVDGGFYLYFMDGETKTYIEIYEYSAGKVGVHLTTETPTNKYTVNADLGILVSNVAGNDYYLGTYDKITDGVVTASYTTMSASKLSYITGDNASKIGVSQFPSYLATIEFVKAAE